MLSNINHKTSTSLYVSLFILRKYFSHTLRIFADKLISESLWKLKVL